MSNILYDYIIEDGKLVWANPNVYLNFPGGYSSYGKTICNTGLFFDEIGGIYFKTGFIPPNEASNYIGSYNDDQNPNIATYCYCVYSTKADGTVNDFFNLSVSFFGVRLVDGTAKSGSLEEFNRRKNALGKGWECKLTRTDSTSWVMDGVFTKNKLYTGLKNHHVSIYIGSSFNKYGQATGYPTFRKVYEYKFWDLNQNLIRHFVPVPTGLKIGDYTVPSNGMWDIVEQKFYGNSGTGEFTYREGGQVKSSIEL